MLYLMFFHLEELLAGIHHLLFQPSYLNLLGFPQLVDGFDEEPLVLLKNAFYWQLEIRLAHQLVIHCEQRGKVAPCFITHDEVVEKLVQVFQGGLADSFMGLLHLVDYTRERRFTFLRIHQVLRSFLNLVLTVKYRLFAKLWPVVVILTVIIFYVREFAFVPHFLENCTPL